MTTPPTPETAAPAPDGAPSRVLVVEHAGAGREALGGRVEREGHGVDTAGDAGEALRKLRTGSFDLVLLDAQTPGMNAPGLLEELRSDAELARIPVIVVSAVDDLDAVERCLASGADDYLPAVFRPAMLRARLSAALDRRRVRDAESLSREMDVARNIQRDFLPESLPKARGMQLEAVLQPARQVSGDFYDAFVLAPSGTIVLVVGDVCDKGVGAALFMALFRSLIRASADPIGGGAIQMIGGRRTIVRQSLEAATPADLLTRVAGFTNDYIARLHGRTNMFATVFLGALDPRDGQLDFVNAGHEPAIVIAPDGTTRELRPTGPALGLMPDVVYGAGQATVEAGHGLVAFTDGLVEARSPAGEAFGGERLRGTLRANNTSASNLVRGVLEALRAFTGPAEPHDDVTLLAATRIGG
jgi:serine phosphatase RsbU (regulator of sigma subunit)